MLSARQSIRTSRRAFMVIAVFAITAGGFAYGIAKSDGWPSFVRSRRGLGNTMSVGGLVGGVIFIFVMVAILPDAISEIENTNTTGWDLSAIALWGILSTVIIAGIVIGVWKNYSGGG